MNILPIYRNRTIYKVKKGDSLYSIALKYKTTVDEIKKINDLDNNLLTEGQTLYIEKQQQDHIGLDICDQQSVEQIKDKYDTYIVKQNDSLYEIAKKYNTTINNLIYINDLKNNLLSLGQKLLVPHIQNYIIYEVKQGDSLYVISSNYNVTPKQIIDLNNLKSTTLNAGQKLKIPTNINNKF